MDGDAIDGYSERTGNIQNAYSHARCELKSIEQYS